MRVPSAVQRRAEAAGEAGRAWLAGLPALTAALAAEWGLTLGRVFAGGTAALVVEATTAAGRRAILKVSLPGVDENESQVLIAAGGRGYAEVLAHDDGRNALLLERLGPRLAQLKLPVADQIEAICATLEEAWKTPPDARFLPGDQKARDLAAFIVEYWPKAGRACSERTVDLALAYCGTREAAHDPAKTVLAHGDAHAHNTLLVQDDRPRRFKFVDPDGLFIEPAYDLAGPMRDFGAELLAGDPAALLNARCDGLARRMRVDRTAIWEWGFIERVSSGLLLKTLKFHKEAREFLAVADAVASAEA
jgi:streptomycin 6-kinase